MKNVINVSNVATILYPVLIDGRWYVADCSSDKIVYQTSFTVKSLSEMLCANMMGMKVNEAKRLWDSLEMNAYNAVA